MSTPDAYEHTASAYDLFASAYRPDQIAALDAAIPTFQPETGVIVDVGSGSGLNAEYVLENVPSSRVLAIEPSQSMRSLIFSKLASHPEWFDRITVRPETFSSAPLPHPIGGAIILGVLGHFDTKERSQLFKSLADRLPAGGGILLDLQAPERPSRVEPFEFTRTRIGDLTYVGTAEAAPVDGEKMSWTMRYRTLEGDRVLSENATRHIYHHPDADTVAREAQGAGLTMSRLQESTFWLLTRS